MVARSPGLAMRWFALNVEVDRKWVIGLLHQTESGIAAALDCRWDLWQVCFQEGSGIQFRQRPIVWQVLGLLTPRVWYVQHSGSATGYPGHVFVSSHGCSTKHFIRWQVALEEMCKACLRAASPCPLRFCVCHLQPGIPWHYCVKLFIIRPPGS